jgi:superfamily II DNA or RNA helicase
LDFLRALVSAAWQVYTPTSEAEIVSIWRRAHTLLPSGVYDELVSEALEARLAELQNTHAMELSDVRRDSDIDEPLVSLVRDAVRMAVESTADAQQKIAIARDLLLRLEQAGHLRPGEALLRQRVLRSIAPITAGLPVHHHDRPRGSLLSSGLITNAHNDSVLSHLASEFESADRIDLLCSFIKLSGLDKFRPLIERHLARKRPLRVLTTTYMRATEFKAVALLHRLGAQVRISYDDSTTRLHAKAWVFHRDSEYSTAYVGSSNLSHAAQTEGLEWNVRIAQADQPLLLEEIRAMFDSYWADGDRFEPFDGTEPVTRRLVRALSESEHRSDFVSFDLEPKEWQKPILRELEQARALGRNRNLVVAATGTGKTLIAAFDYERLLRERQVDSLLFVAHRKEILEQSRRVFRHVLRREHFGELWVDGSQPETGNHVFASIQSLAARELPADRYDHVIVDEVHHAAADSYEKLLRRLAPRQLVGLTATPERADGRVYEAHFPRPYVGNLRVWDAIQQQVLVPFRYFVLDVEGVDLTEARWEGGYVNADLSQRLVRAQDFWVRAIVSAIAERVARPSDIRSLAFCVDKAHAHVVAERLSREGLTARALTHDTSREERDRAKGDLISGRVQVLCVVDLFNEGVDIPHVNTLFLFRPTESATVFLQQLGRGLRRSHDKDILTVFDVTGRQHPSFRFDRHLRELLGHTPRELREFVETGRGRLPSGCTIHFEEQAQRDILERIRRAIPVNVDGLRALLQTHRDDGWDLTTFLRETEVDLMDLYRSGRSWTSLRAEVGMATMPSDETEQRALGNAQKLLHVSDAHRLSAWKRLLGLEFPNSEFDRRLAAMLFVILYDRFDASQLRAVFDRWAAHAALREELGQLLPVLEQRADALPHSRTLSPETPLALHGQYLDVELSVAFAAIARTDGKYRRFYTGVEPVAQGRHDLLLVTLDKGDVKHEHLQYADFPLSEWLFQWQSKSGTEQTSAQGQRHLEPAATGVTPLLFVRESKRDARGVTNAFRYLGPVHPRSHRGERPITIDWELETPILPEWVRRWRNVS